MARNCKYGRRISGKKSKAGLFRCRKKPAPRGSMLLRVQKRRCIKAGKIWMPRKRITMKNGTTYTRRAHCRTKPQ